jgi:predicted DNA-binding transcriptional regulator AlpA
MTQLNIRRKYMKQIDCPGVLAPSLIRPKELAKRFGMSEAFIWKLRSEGELPPAVQLGRGSKSAIGWREEDIAEWINSRIEGGQ